MIDEWQFFNGRALLASAIEPPATCQRPAHVDTTHDALDIGSNYRKPVSIADVSRRWVVWRGCPTSMWRGS